MVIEYYNRLYKPIAHDDSCTGEKKKENPYHIEMIRVELQLRTMIMDAWAGMDNRVSYKNDKKVSPEMEHRIEKYAKIGRRLDKLIQNTLDDAKVSDVTA